MMKVILLIFGTGLVFGRRWWCVAAVLGFVDYTCWFLFPGSELIVGRGHRYGCVSSAAPVWLRWWVCLKGSVDNNWVGPSGVKCTLYMFYIYI